MVVFTRTEYSGSVFRCGGPLWVVPDMFMRVCGIGGSYGRVLGIQECEWCLRGPGEGRGQRGHRKAPSIFREVAGGRSGMGGVWDCVQTLNGGGAAGGSSCGAERRNPARSVCGLDWQQARLGACRDQTARSLL